MGKIVVTGAAGFIGSHLVDALLSLGHQVVGVDNLSMGRLENVQEHLENPNFSFNRMDVRELSGLRCASAGAECIVHLAALKIPRYGGALNTLLVNMDGSRAVFEVAREQGNCKVILASTSDVYGKNPDLPFREDADLVLGPTYSRRWSYAVSKIFDEHLAYAYHEEFALPFVILRLFGSYGPRHHVTWWGGPQGVFIEAILKGEEVPIHGDGGQTRTFTYVSDTVAGIVAAIEKPQASGQVFNVGGDQEISILGLARLIGELCGKSDELRLKFIPYASFGGRYEDVMRRVPDVSKTEEILGFKAKVSLRDGLLKTIEWHKNSHVAG